MQLLFLFLHFSFQVPNVLSLFMLISYPLIHLFNLAVNFLSCFHVALLWRKRFGQRTSSSLLTGWLLTHFCKAPLCQGDEPPKGEPPCERAKM